MTEVALGKFVPSVLMKNLMLNKWGTTMVDGVEVFTEKRYVYPTLDSDFEYMLKRLKMLAQVKESIRDPKGIQDIYLYMNKEKLETNSAVFFDQVIADKFEAMFPVNTEIKATVNVLDLPVVEDMTKAEAVTYIQANWGTLLAEDKVQSSAVSDVDDIQGRFYKYLLFDYQNTTREFDVVMGDVTIGTYSKKDILGPVTWYASYSFDVTFIRTAPNISINSAIVDGLQTSYTSNTATYQDGDSTATAQVPVYFAERDEIYGAYFHTFEGITYLRVDSITHPDVGLHKFLLLVQGCMDTGYTKKRVKWWKRVAVAIVAFAIIVLTAGNGTPLALAITYAALTLVVLSMYFAKNGEYALSAHMGKMGGNLGTVSMVAGLPGLYKAGVTWATGTQIASAGLDMHYKSQLGKLDDKRKEQQAALDRYNRLNHEREVNEMDISRQLELAMFNPAELQEQEFETDYLYGPIPGGGKNEFGVHIRKNICRRSF